MLLTLAALSCSFPDYVLSSDAGTSNGGDAGTSAAGTTAGTTAGMGGTETGGTTAGSSGATTGGGRPPGEPMPTAGNGGRAPDGGAAGSGGEAGGTMGAAGEGGVIKPRACADLGDEPPDCLCRDYAGHAYLFCSTAYSWSQGNSRCGFYQTSLAKIESPGEDQWILKQAHGITDPRPLTFFWIGASSMGSPGVWHWPDGAIFWRGNANGNQVDGSYFNWRISNPQKIDAAACVFLDDNGWEEGDCSFKRGYVCEAQ